VILGERPTSQTITAALVIFIGVTIVISRGKSQALREVTEHPDATGR
jgi:drug/metabolite transporter (DMT)-like permease